jgi:hypothetical protein
MRRATSTGIGRPDGRFLMVKEGTPADDTASPQITVVLNWTQEPLERVPVD